MIRLTLYILLLVLCPVLGKAQELNTKLTINTQRVPAANSQLFSSLESELNQLLNDQKWTDTNFNRSERINCNIAITIVEATTENNFVAEIQFASQRPVYNSSYITSLMNYRDTQFEFTYMPGLSFDFNKQSIDNNLVAVISFYAYILIGLDFDSFSLNGGKPYFSKAMEIANMSQSLGTKGWEPFSGKNSNRYDLAVALTEESSGSFHDMWYKYHRLGLDEMAANASRGRIRIIESVNDIQKLYDARPNSILLSLIRETKVDEIVRVCSQATTEEKQAVKKILSQIFPTKSNSIGMLK